MSSWAVPIPIVLLIVVVTPIIFRWYCKKRRRNPRTPNQQDGHDEEENMSGQEDQESSSSVINEHIELGPMIPPKSASSCTIPLLKTSGSTTSGQGAASDQVKLGKGK